MRRIVSLSFGIRTDSLVMTAAHLQDREPVLTCAFRPIFFFLPRVNILARLAAIVTLDLSDLEKFVLVLFVLDKVRRHPFTITLPLRQYQILTRLSHHTTLFLRALIVRKVVDVCWPHRRVVLVGVAANSACDPFG